MLRLVPNSIRIKSRILVRLHFVCNFKHIGRGLAKKLVECGAETYAISRTKSDLESLENECPKIHTVVCDLSKWDETEVAVKSCGEVDLLINNAGVGLLQPFLEVTPGAFEKSIKANVRAIIQVSQIIASGMVKRGQGGSIVNISSQASRAALKDHAVYGATKAAVDSLTATMGLELGPHKIRVNAVNPTVVNTAMGKVGWSDPAKAVPMLAKIPLGRFAGVVLF